MKKSIRILSLLMAFAMLIGSFSVMGSAYAPYKDSAVSYNDVDAPEFTTEQYASMALDELDRMLLKEKIELDIYIGKLDLGSVDTTLASVVSLVASVQNLLPLLGDASALPSYIEPIEDVRRATDADSEVIKALFDFIANIAPLGQKYVNGTVSLGIMNSFIADFIFDVRELAIGLIFGMTNEGKAMGELDEEGNPEGYDYMDDRGENLPDKYLDPNNGALSLAQSLINDLVLGEWVKLDDYFNDPYYPVTYDFYGFKNDETLNESEPDTTNYDYYGWVHPDDWVTVGLGGYARVAEGAAAPAADYSLLDIGAGKIGYDFIEDLLRAAYSNLLIPVLNRDTVRWVRRDICGIEYLDTYTNRNLFGDDPSTEVVEGEGDVEGVWYPNPDYDPDYAGEEFDRAELEKNSVIAKIFDLENATKIEVEEIPDTTTLVDYFNNLLGHVLESVALEEVTVDGVTYDWDWQYGDNSLLFDNIVDAGKFVLQVTGDEFFGSRAFKEEFPTPTAIEQMNGQQVVSMVLRGILNSSVDYIYVEPEYQTLVDVAYRAVEQLAYQDIPQYTYTKPVKTADMTDEDYYDAVVDKMITILFDIAVYNLNQGMDMVPGEGLLEYQGDEGHYNNLLTQIAAWAFSDYAPLLSFGDSLLCYNAEGSAEGLTPDMVWQDIDTIIDAIIPIKGGEGKAPWIAAEIAGDGTKIVSKSFIFDYIIKPVYSLDATNLAMIFKRNENGAFASMDGVEIIVSILNNVFNLLFPGVFQAQDTIDEILNNELLGAMVSDLLKSLGTKSFTSSTGAVLEGRANDIILVGLPLACMLLGLSDEQEFEEMEIYLPETIAATGTIPTFEVINGSSGINTYHTDADGNGTQDQLYKYKIQNVILNQYNAAGTQVYGLNYSGIAQNDEISGGEAVNVTLAGTRNIGDIIELTINYYIYGETGQMIGTDYLSKTVYAYVGNTDEDDDAITISVEDSNGRKVEYEDSIYLSTGDSLTDIEGYNIRVKDNNGGSEANAAVTGVTMTGSNPADLAGKFPFVTMNDGSDESKPISQTMTGQEGLYFFSPFAVAEKADGEKYERYEDFYAVDEETGELILDENEEPVVSGNNEGVEDGQYNVATTLRVGDKTATVNTTIHLYNDYGLEGLFSRAVSANRQLSNYDKLAQSGIVETHWATYRSVLMEAARLVLMPKEGDDFASEIVANDPVNYDNRYEELAEDLEAAIEQLEEFALDTGIQSVWNAVDAISGINHVATYTPAVTADGQSYTIVTKEDIEYYEDDYVFFGMRDFVPHTYNRYKDARKLAYNIIDSQEFFAPEDPREIEYYVPSEEEILNYEKAMEEYIERRLDLPAVNSIEATYAIHMVNLTSARLIPLEGDTSKLQIVYNAYANVDTSSGTFVGESKEAYDHAVAFAAEVLAESDPRPSKVNVATTKLVDTWKDLELAGDYTKVESAIAAFESIYDAYGPDPSAQFVYTEDSYRTFLNAYNDALRARDEKPYSVDEQDQIDAIAETLNAVELVLAGAAGGDEASVEFKTENQYLYSDHDYALYFVPRVSEGTLNHSYYGATLADGTTVDGYVVGYGVGCLYDEDTLLAAYDMTNCTAEVVAGGDTYSTGTSIKFLDNKGDVVKTYVVVVIGDINGDNSYDGVDAMQIELNAAYVTDWEWGGTNEEFKAAAADITNEGMLDSNDANSIKKVAAYQGTINQEVSPYGDSSFIAY
ncbi:MAG: hypothetical protein IJE19_05800 [Clostridia bacterium]|nr:hypothetical protein [Clostridia bacterium]